MARENDLQVGLTGRRKGNLMTSVAVWAGVDTHGVASLYVAGDSRITWRDSARSYSWDQGRKVFTCGSKPHIFGYWGDVLFPALAIPLLADRIDRGMLGDSGGDWHDDVGQAIRRLWSDYPAPQRRDLGLIHGFRAGDGTGCRFGLSVSTYEQSTDTWETRQIAMPSRSALMTMAGSGTRAFREAHDLWQASQEAATSRAVFGAFCESLAGKKDPNTGGAPQLAGLYRIGPGRLFGVVHDGQRYFGGAALVGAEQPAQVEWRNHLFERADGVTRQRLRGAQRHSPRT